MYDPRAFNVSESIGNISKGPHKQTPLSLLFIIFFFSFKIKIMFTDFVAYPQVNCFMGFFYTCQTCFNSPLASSSTFLVT